MIPQRQGPDPVRIFIAMALIAFLILIFEIFTILFAPREPRKQETVKEEVKEQKEEIIPKLLLGTTREKAGKGETVSFDFEGFSLDISEKGGRIVRFIDKTFGFDLITEAERSFNVYPLEVFTGDPELDFKLNLGEYEIKREGNTILMKLKDEDIKFIKKLEFKDSYFLISIDTDINKKLFILAGTYPSEEAFYTHEGPILKINGKVVRIDIEDIEGRTVLKGDIEFAGEESRYFFKGFKGKIDTVVIEKTTFRKGEETKEITFTLVSYEEPLNLYMGAKYYSRIRELGLGDLLDYGMLKIIVKPLFLFMYWVYEFTGSWIFSIVLLTLILRIIFFPLNYKSMVSMMKLQEAAPKLEKIRNKYKDDPVKMQEEIMKLYSELGVNPFSGCLPILIQIPIFFALYKVLIITVDLKLTGLLWIPSLADKDPFYILPIIMGLTMILQQKFMPSPDPKQNLIMYISAVVFTFLFANFPSGLVLYWTVNNILNIVQNYIIKKILQK